MNWLQNLSAVLDLFGWAWGIVASLVALAYRRQWLKRGTELPSVHIKALKVGEAEKARIHPEVLILLFSGMPLKYNDDETGMHYAFSPKEFETLVSAGDWRAAGVSERTPGMGSAIKAIAAYQSLKKVYLITTLTRHGVGSWSSVPLLRAYVSDLMKREGLEIIADEAHRVSTDEDTQLTEQTFEVVRLTFQHLATEYEPGGSRILVDLTGGTTPMKVGALLACLGRDQDVHVVGSHYDAERRIKESFPMVVQFWPERTEAPSF
jgi:hypothetical protein